MVDVPDIVFEFLFPGDGVAAVDLRPACNAGPYLVSAVLEVVVQGQVAHQQGAGAHQAHIAPEHVDQLGQLIEAGRAQEVAEPGLPLFVGQQHALRIAGIGHRAELDHPERLAVPSRPLLGEEHRPAQLPGNQQGQHQQDGRKDDQAQEGGGEVEWAFNG